ncbi:hypothetical protein WMY93_014889 [Mugilogobius chulae]|uniref:CCDC113/CCDC96 coiled-coil domain-containing protein n=1 Tax=Mugilogobius chulae TaxID=88201 RepID=A0AAW0P7V7_9GOBI
MKTNECSGDKTSEINQEDLQFIDSLLPEALTGEGDGPHQLHHESPERETTPAEHERASSVYTTCCEEYALLLEQLTEEQANAIEHNRKLQKKLARILARLPKEEIETVVGLQGELHEKSYEEGLKMLTELKQQMKVDGETARRQTEELKMQVQERLSKVEREWRELLSVKRDVAVTVMSRRWAKSYAVAKVESVLTSEEKHQVELTTLRLQNFSLENRIRRLEQQIREADLNATNPFQREYEKLHARKTEEKRNKERREKEALKVEKRVVKKLEMLFNIKQKLHNTETEVQHQLEKLSQVDAILAQQRDKLARVKQARNSLEKDNAKLREQRGLLGNEVLLRDYDYTKKAIPGKFTDDMTEEERKQAEMKTEKAKRWQYLCGRSDFETLDKINGKSYIARCILSEEKDPRLARISLCQRRQNAGSQNCEGKQHHLKMKVIRS